MVCNPTIRSQAAGIEHPSIAPVQKWGDGVAALAASPPLPPVPPVERLILLIRRLRALKAGTVAVYPLC